MIKDIKQEFWGPWPRAVCLIVLAFVFSVAGLWLLHLLQLTERPTWITYLSSLLGAATFITAPLWWLRR